MIEMVPTPCAALFQLRCNSAEDVDSVCRTGLAALGQPAVVLYQDPKLAASRADIVRQGSALRNSRPHGDAPPSGSTDHGKAVREVLKFCIVYCISIRL